jgi:protocatechuate 3,4-dioxygenase, alpha subunit
VTTRGRYDLYRGQTPGQTLGPFFHQGLLRTKNWFQVPRVCEDAVDVINHVLVDERTPGKRLRLSGNVYDGQGEPVSDALIELWQADALGRYQHPLQASLQPGGPVSGGPIDDGPAFRGFGRAATDPSGAFFFVTIKPGRVPGARGSVQAPHFNLIIGARGLARHAFTRVYFEDDAELAHDPVLSLVPAERRPTLIAAPVGTSTSDYRFDIHLQGENETVFFEI